MFLLQLNYRLLKQNWNNLEYAAGWKSKPTEPKKTKTTKPESGIEKFKLLVYSMEQ